MNIGTNSPRFIQRLEKSTPVEEIARIFEDDGGVIIEGFLSDTTKRNQQRFRWTPECHTPWQGFGFTRRNQSLSRRKHSTNDWFITVQ